MSYSGSSAQGSICYDQARVVDDMSDLGSHEFKPLDATNNSGLWMT